MAIDLRWDDAAETVIHCNFEGLWTWQDFCGALDEMFAMMASVHRTVDIILDIRNSIPPSEVASLRSLKHTAIPDNAGSFVLIGNITFSNLVCFVFRRIYQMGDTFFVADSMERARRILAKRRSQASAG